MQVEFHLTFIVDSKMKQDAKNWTSGSNVSSAAQQQLFSIMDLGFLQYPKMTRQICKIICL